jgi:hypothetical protein
MSGCRQAAGDKEQKAEEEKTYKEAETSCCGKSSMEIRQIGARKRATFLAYALIRRTVTVSSSEALVSFYQTTWDHIPEATTLHSHCHENIRTKIKYYPSDRDYWVFWTLSIVRYSKKH